MSEKGHRPVVAVSPVLPPKTAHIVPGDVMRAHVRPADDAASLGEHTSCHLRVLVDGPGLVPPSKRIERLPSPHSHEHARLEVELVVRVTSRYDGAWPLV